MNNNKEINTEVVIIGGGPGGYTAALKIANTGQKCILIEKYNNLGGICLNAGCIPSKSLLYIASFFKKLTISEKFGIIIDKKTINFNTLRNWKNNIINKLSNSIKKTILNHNITLVNGIAYFTSKNSITIKNKNIKQKINFKYAIISSGSIEIKMPDLPNHVNILYPTDALEIKSIPENLLIIGGGVIGTEMATFFNAFGSKITIIEANNKLLQELDFDTNEFVYSNINNISNIMLNTQITKIKEHNNEFHVHFKTQKNTIQSQYFSHILIAIGRKANINNLQIENANIMLNKNNFISVDNQQRTNIKNILQ